MPARPPGPDAQFAALVARFSPEVVALAKRCHPKLRRALPGAFEIVYDYGKSVVVSFSASERGYEGIVTASIQADGLRLYVPKNVPDPQGRLEGTGTKVRFVVVESASDLDRGDVHDLVEAAKALSGAKFPISPAGGVIFKEQKKKPKRG